MSLYQKSDARISHLRVLCDGRHDFVQRPQELATSLGRPTLSGPFDPHCQKLVTERIAADNPEREDSPRYLLKRLKQLEQEDAALRQKKRSRPEDATAELKERARH